VSKVHDDPKRFPRNKQGRQDVTNLLTIIASAGKIVINS